MAALFGTIRDMNTPLTSPRRLPVKIKGLQRSRGGHFSLLWFAHHPWILVAISTAALGLRLGSDVWAAGIEQSDRAARVAVQNELREAARWGNVAETNRALRRGAQPNGDFSVPPLLHAVEWNDRDVAHVLLERGADPNKGDRFGRSTPLLAAVSSYHIPEGERASWLRLLRQWGARADGEDGANALRYAVRTNRTEVAAALMQAGASPNTFMATGETALTYAVHHEFDRTALTLVAFGARQ